jgi:hypothetical protein
MDNDEIPLPDPPLQKLVVVGRKVIRELTYRLRAAGLSAGEALYLERTQDELLLLSIFAFCERFTKNSLNEDQTRALMICFYLEWLKLVEMQLPVVLSCDLATGIDLTIAGLDDGWCWNAFRYRKAGLQRLFANSR